MINNRELDLIKAEVFSAKLSNNRLHSSVVNRLIKKALSRVFGSSNVKVKRPYSYIHIDILTTRPSNCTCEYLPNRRYFYCSQCNAKRDEIQRTVTDIIKYIGLYDDLPQAYDEMGDLHPAYIISVYFTDEVTKSR